MHKYKRKDKMCVFYIDLKSAYNTVNRSKLFEIMKKNKILDKEEIIFLEHLYNNIFYKSYQNNERFYLPNGVP